MYPFPPEPNSDNDAPPPRVRTTIGFEQRENPVAELGGSDAFCTSAEAGLQVCGSNAVRVGAFGGRRVGGGGSARQFDLLCGPRKRSASRASMPVTENLPPRFQEAIWSFPIRFR
jgi:hypothetical protein